MDEPDLPPLVTAVPLLRCKRTRDEYEPATSSDPALFSSDDQPASADTYSIKRRREQWPGTWWGKNVPVRKKQPFRRNLDSGIFLGSEGTDDSLDEEFLREQSKLLEQNNAPFITTSALIEAGPVVDKWTEVSKFDRVIAIVQESLEECREDIDLSSMGLDELPPDIESLKSLTKVATVPDFKPSEQAYHPIEAELRLFLANNKFTKIPNHVFRLKNLRLLSLRQNNLVCIPHAIGTLEQLQSLNISSNRLAFIPVELLRLISHFNLKDFIADPNPWTQVPDSAAKLKETSRLDRNQYVMRRAAISNVEILRPCGVVERTVPFSMLQSIRRKQPSLAELALNRMTTMQSFQNINEWIDEGIPAPVREMLNTGLAYSAIGHRQCLCGQSFILPAKQWLEWWNIDKISTGPSLKLPFLRQFCSRCVPDHD